LSNKAVGVGRSYVWDSGSLLIGRSQGETVVHAHHAIQIALTTGTISFRPENGTWVDYRGAVITPDYPHAFASYDNDVAHVFVEPESRPGRAILDRIGTTGIAAIPRTDVDVAVPILFELWAKRPGAASMMAAAQRVIEHFAGTVEPSRVTDERVARAIAYMKANISGPLTLDELADVASLSPGRFRHLFVGETGMTVRLYILWLRFQRAWELIGAGSSLSSAAHGAGFSDAAHLSRTSRRMFGAPPVAIQMERDGFRAGGK
jgi:AraC-like DNA-binding protein